MARLPEAITADITDYFGPHTRQFENDYLCVYGGSIYKTEGHSDIDLFVVTHGSKLAVDGLITFISKLHETHDRKVDVEVPYENKVLYTSDEVYNATTYSGFDVVNDEIVVPPIQKNQAFLRSPAVKARLVLNALTTPHVIFGKDLSQYHTARVRAEDAVTLLAAKLTDRDEGFTVNDLYNQLTTNPDGEAGEMYLGYKTDYPIVASHLLSFLHDSTDRLSADHTLQRIDDTFRVPAGFNPHARMTANTRYQ